MTNSSKSTGRTLDDIINELLAAAEDIRINKLSDKEAEKRYSHMTKFVDYLEQTEPELKEKAEKKLYELRKQRFFEDHGIKYLGGIEQ